MEWSPSSRRPAAVHRTVALNCSSHAPYKAKIQVPQKQNLDFWSEWRDSNSRHPGPKPGALPTGPHPDIKLRENARCGQIWGQRDSTTFSGNFQERRLGEIGGKRGSVQHLRQSNRFGAPAPKAGALPTALHPDIKLWRPNSKRRKNERTASTLHPMSYASGPKFKTYYNGLFSKMQSLFQNRF